MKKLNFSEIQKLLTTEEIEEVLSGLLISRNDEYFISNLEENPQWNSPEHKVFHTSSNMSNLNWLYYKDVIKQLQPKGLNIGSDRISSFSGLGEMVTLETITLGTTSRHDALRLSTDELKSFLDECFKLPRLKEIKIFAYNSSGGSVNSHLLWLEEIGAYISEFYPDSETDGYFPFISRLQYSRESHEISGVQTRIEA